MANQPAKIKQAELTRYVAGVVKAGVTIGKISIAPNGTITIVPAGSPSDDSANPCDRLLD
ncbi:hypothetical protein SAMN05216376_11240 [Mameliella alba]|uniref:hypothetical protein n=1 Tax=Mameliella alba TaxID=561184 RepID=UPI0008828404|nr:hypothetical protein [Mameliella alba]MBV6634748.1 hypothetical protein [Mameliella sp.]OWV46146.1 hypothetical protein CDZ96_19885 [Mameliella alba]PTR37009.1 hypothetical protein LX94_03801 [Mameliella alba]SDD81950.1 hypothetical protein SAMN05216376_11240 [Mameliella alba]GGF76966.1 hypothetical protein GCM10011319_41640 [Mameliella alba]